MNKLELISAEDLRGSLQDLRDMINEMRDAPKEKLWHEKEKKAMDKAYYDYAYGLRKAFEDGFYDGYVTGTIQCHYCDEGEAAAYTAGNETGYAYGETLTGRAVEAERGEVSYESV